MHLILQLSIFYKYIKLPVSSFEKDTGSLYCYAHNIRDRKKSATAKPTFSTFLFAADHFEFRVS